MRTETRPRVRARDLPDLDAEQEVDVGRLWRTLAARWWLPVIGLLGGIVLGYALSLGAGDVYRAQAVVYLGQAIAPNGAPIPSLATSPDNVAEIVRSEAALSAAAARSGMRLGELRQSISTQAVSAATTRRGPAQAQLVRVSVQGEARRRVAIAANALAQRAVAEISGYPQVKIRGFERRLAGINSSLASIERRIDVLNAASSAAGLTFLERLVLTIQVDNAEQRRTQLIGEQSATQQNLALANVVERARVVEPALATPTTARSRRNSMLAGAGIGLILGTLAAFLWAPLTARFERRTA